jgi:xanthine dehydrogenase accessory factor
MADRTELGRLALDPAIDRRSSVLVRTIGLRGLAARSPLEAMLVLDDGRRVGSIAGGRLDPSIDRAIAELDAPATDATRILVSDAQRDDGCAGIAELLVQRIGQLPERYWAPAERPDVAVTLLASPLGVTLGATAVIAADGTIVGTLGDEHLDAGAARAADAMRRASRSTDDVADLDTGERVLMEVRRRAATLVLVTGGDLAEATAALARTLGWVVHQEIEADAAIERLRGCGPGDAVVVMTHDPAVDEPVLAFAASTDIGYVGVLGSRRVHRARHDRLRRLGVTEAVIARLRGPAGLDVGAWTPAETAVSIVAEILAVRSGRSGRPFLELDASIHP